MLRRYAVPAVLDWALVGAGAVQAGPRVFVLTDRVDEGGPAFTVEPHERRLALGGAVRWRNDGHVSRMLEDRSGLFEWGPIAPRDALRFEPWTAGTYRFRESVSRVPGVGEVWDEGIFTVEPTFDYLRSVKRGILWRVRWASRRAPEGLVYEVQAVRRDGQRWRPWKQAASRPFGVYRSPPEGNPHRPYCIAFRSRLKDPEDPQRRLAWGANPVLCWVA